VKRGPLVFTPGGRVGRIVDSYEEARDWSAPGMRRRLMHYVEFGDGTCRVFPEGQLEPVKEARHGTS